MLHYDVEERGPRVSMNTALDTQVWLPQQRIDDTISKCLDAGKACEAQNGKRVLTWWEQMNAHVDEVLEDLALDGDEELRNRVMGLLSRAVEESEAHKHKSLIIGRVLIEETVNEAALAALSEDFEIVEDFHR